MRRPVSNITGKPTIPVPGRLDLAVLQQLADNVRERLRQLDAEATYLRSIADNGTPKQTIAALEAAILSLRQQLVLLAQQVAELTIGEPAEIQDPLPESQDAVRSRLDAIEQGSWL